MTQWGEPLGTAVLKSQATDFKVFERLHFKPDGEGEHLLLNIRRQDMTTAEVVRRLGKATRVQRRNISFSGTKDKVADVCQWFSVWLPGKEFDLAKLEGTGLEILEAGRHRKKLRRGAHKWNGFELILRDVDAPIDAVNQRLEAIQSHGYPNFFGIQRFGHNNSNLQRAERCEHIDELGRQDRSFMLSAIRAEIFNEVLSHRLDNDVMSIADGDIATFTDGGSWFQVPERDEEIAERERAQRIVVTGPLWGLGGSAAENSTAKLENAIAARFPHYIRLLEQAKMAPDRRALKVFPKDLQWQWLGTTTLKLRFDLPKSAYATSLIDNLVRTGDA